MRPRALSGPFTGHKRFERSHRAMMSPPSGVDVTTDTVRGVDDDGPIVVAWRDLICTRHTAEAVGGVWPFETVDVYAIRQQCDDCLSRIDPHLPPPNVLWQTSSHRDLNPDQRRHLSAVSAAATAVTGILAGSTLDYVDADPNSSLGGTCWWGSNHRATIDYIATLWVGNIATLRYLVEIGLDTPARRLEAAAGSWRDQAHAHKFTAEHHLDLAASRDHAALLVDEHWGTINAVADALVDRHVLRGDDVQAIMRR